MGHPVYTTYSFDILISALNAIDIGNYQNIGKLLEIACVSPIALAEAKQGAPAVRRLKTVSRNTMMREKEENLSLIQMQSLIENDISKLLVIIILNRHRKLPPSSFFKQNNQIKDCIFVRDFVIITAI